VARFGYDITGDNGWLGCLEGIAIRYPFSTGAPDAFNDHACMDAGTFGDWPAVMGGTASSPTVPTIWCDYSVTNLVAQSIGFVAVASVGYDLAQAAIYDGDGNFLGKTSSVTVTDIAATHLAPLSSTVILTPGEKYWLAVWTPGDVAVPYDLILEYSAPTGSTAITPSPTAAGGAIMAEATPGAFLGKACLGREDTYGDQTSVTSFLWPCLTNISVQSNHNVVEVNCKTGDRGVANTWATRFSAEGRFRCEIGPENIHKLLYWAHGAHAIAATLSGTAGGATVDAYEHNIATNGNATPYSFSAWVDFGEGDRMSSTVVTVIPGMFMTGYDIVVADRALLSLDADYIAKTQELVSPTAAMIPSLSGLQPFTAKPHLSTVELGGRSIAAQLVDTTLRYSTGVSARENAGSRFVTGGYAGRGRFEVSFTLDFDDVASVVDFMGTSPTTAPSLPVAMQWPRREETLRFRWTSDEVAVYQAGVPTYYAVEAYVPRFQFNTMVRELPEDSDSPLRVDFTGVGAISTAATTVALRGDVVWRLWNRLSAADVTS